MSGNSRYTPQMRLPEIGIEGQKRLTESKVLVIGCGALGSLLSMYLAGAGVGKLILADFDTIEISNLHRQLFYRHSEAGKPKATSLAESISMLNPDVFVQTLNEFITPEILKSLTADVDIIVDAADNPSTTYMIDSYCVERSLPYSTAGVRGWNAQIYTWMPEMPAYGEIVPENSGTGGVLPCSVEGIMGPTAGVAASIQASEVIKTLLGINKGNFLLDINLLTLEIRKLFVK